MLSVLVSRVAKPINSHTNHLASQDIPLQTVLELGGPRTWLVTGPVTESAAEPTFCSLHDNSIDFCCPGLSCSTEENSAKTPGFGITWTSNSEH